MTAWFPKPEIKVCTRCKVPKKRAENFPIEKRRRDSVGPWCFDCLNAWRREYWRTLQVN